eukprot:g4463.t1
MACIRNAFCASGTHSTHWTADIAREGELAKCSASRLNPEWKNRYFWLYVDGTLESASSTDSTSFFRIHLDADSHVTQCTRDKRHCIKVQFAGRNVAYYLEAPGRPELMQWASCIHQIVVRLQSQVKSLNELQNNDDENESSLLEMAPKFGGRSGRQVQSVRLKSPISADFESGSFRSLQNSSSYDTDDVLVGGEGSVAYQVIIEQITARNLRKRDKLGRVGLRSMSPRCVLTFGDERNQSNAFSCETEVLVDTCNPKWADKFVFQYRVNKAEDLMRPEMLLKAEIMDENKLVRGQIIGTFQVSLFTVASGPTHYDYELKDHHNLPAGRLLFNIQMRQWKKWSVSFSAQLALNRDAIDLQAEVNSNAEDNYSAQARDTSEDIYILRFRKTVHSAGGEKTVVADSQVPKKTVSEAAAAAAVVAGHNLSPRRLQTKKLLDDTSSLSSSSGTLDEEYAVVKAKRNSARRNSMRGLAKITGLFLNKGKNEDAKEKRSEKIVEEKENGLSLRRNVSLTAMTKHVQLKQTRKKSLSDSDLKSALSNVKTESEKISSTESKELSSRNSFSSLQERLTSKRSLTKRGKSSSGSYVDKVKKLLYVNAGNLLKSPRRHKSKEKTFENVSSSNASSSADIERNKGNVIFESSDPDENDFIVWCKGEIPPVEVLGTHLDLLAGAVQVMLLRVDRSSKVIEDSKNEPSVAEMDLDPSYGGKDDVLQVKYSRKSFDRAFNMSDFKTHSLILVGQFWISLRRAYEMDSWRLNDNSGRRDAEVKQLLMLNGRRVGEASVHIRFCSPPETKQVVAGVLSEIGITAASAIIVGEVQAGMFQTRQGLPPKMKQMQAKFRQLRDAQVKSTRSSRLLTEMKELMLDSDKHTTLCFLYPSKESLCEAQELIIDVCSFLRRKSSAIHGRMRWQLQELLLIMLKRGEVSDIELLGFKIVNTKVSRIQSPVTDEKVQSTRPNLKLCCKVRGLLMMCLEEVVTRIIRSQIIETEELTYAAGVMALCATRYSNIRRAFFQAVMTPEQEQQNIDSWQPVNFYLNEKLYIEGKLPLVPADLNDDEDDDDDNSVAAKIKRNREKEKKRISSVVSLNTSISTMSDTTRRRRTSTIAQDFSLLLLDWKPVDDLLLVTKEFGPKVLERQEHFFWKKKYVKVWANKLSGVTKKKKTKKKKGESNKKRNDNDKSNFLPGPSTGTLLFHRFAMAWVMNVIERIGLFARSLGGGRHNTMSCKWEEVPGYRLLLRVVMLQLGSKAPHAWPDSLVDLATLLLCDHRNIAPFVKIALQKTNLNLNLQCIKATIDTVAMWIRTIRVGFKDRKTMWNQSLKSLCRSRLPPTFDFRFFQECLRRLLTSHRIATVMKTVWLLGHEWDSLPTREANRLARWLLRHHFFRLMLHWWRPHCTPLMCRLILYRVTRRRYWHCSDELRRTKSEFCEQGWERNRNRSVVIAAANASNDKLSGKLPSLGRSKSKQKDKKGRKRTRRFTRKYTEKKNESTFSLMYDSDGSVRPNAEGDEVDLVLVREEMLGDIGIPAQNVPWDASCLDGYHNRLNASSFYTKDVKSVEPPPSPKRKDSKEAGFSPPPPRAPPKRPSSVDKKENGTAESGEGKIATAEDDKESTSFHKVKKVVHYDTPSIGDFPEETASYHEIGSDRVEPSMYNFDGAREVKGSDCLRWLRRYCGEEYEGVETKIASAMVASGLMYPIRGRTKWKDKGFTAKSAMPPPIGLSVKKESVQKEPLENVQNFPSLKSSLSQSLKSSADILPLMIEEEPTIFRSGEPRRNSSLNFQSRFDLDFDEDWTYLCLPVATSSLHSKKGNGKRKSSDLGAGHGIMESSIPVWFDRLKGEVVGVNVEIRRLCIACIRHMQRMLLPFCDKQLKRVKTIRPQLEAVLSDRKKYYKSKKWTERLEGYINASAKLAQHEGKTMAQMRESECKLKEASACRREAAKAHRAALTQDISNVDRAVEIAKSTCRRVAERNAESLIHKIENELRDIEETFVLYTRLQAVSHALTLLDIFDRDTLAETTLPPAIESAIPMKSRSEKEVKSGEEDYIAASYIDNYNRSFVVRESLVAYALRTFHSEDLVLQDLIQKSKIENADGNGRIPMPEFACELVTHSDSGHAKNVLSVH